ncbi:MAG: hypothetical protein KBE04_07740 [Phycisphaerae bacterium]|nr:hypothetical protein [Phycisphaerae bacterium]
MKRAKSIATHCGLAIGLFLGVAGYHFVVNGDLRHGVVTGLVAAGLVLLVRGGIGLLRGRMPTESK